MCRYVYEIFPCGHDRCRGWEFCGPWFNLTPYEREKIRSTTSSPCPKAESEVEVRSYSRKKADFRSAIDRFSKTLENLLSFDLRLTGINAQEVDTAAICSSPAADQIVSQSPASSPDSQDKPPEIRFKETTDYAAVCSTTAEDQIVSQPPASSPDSPEKPPGIWFKVASIPGGISLSQEVTLPTLSCPKCKKCSSELTRMLYSKNWEKVYKLRTSINQTKQDNTTKTLSDSPEQAQEREQTLQRAEKFMQLIRSDDVLGVLLERSPFARSSIIGPFQHLQNEEAESKGAESSQQGSSDHAGQIPIEVIEDEGVWRVKDSRKSADTTS
ncbi:MAG: hypothetical protein Q9220_005509 [cf. Caloplaca sp. 1 TL-2023]